MTEQEYVRTVYADTQEDAVEHVESMATWAGYTVARLSQVTYTRPGTEPHREAGDFKVTLIVTDGAA